MAAIELAQSAGKARARRNFLITALVAFLAGAVGAAFGATVILARHAPETPGLHVLVHEGLDLSAEQERALHALEDDFAVRREALEARLAEANRELAAAIEAHPSYTPEVSEAVEHLHTAMGDLQEATIQHVYAMRAILTDEQAEIFDERITQALAGSAP
jgi:Spy/CpxP family protein refolding chaperone